MGVPLLAAYLLIFYYGCLSVITPPEAIGAYVGASLAGADPIKTGWTACRIGLVAFIVTFSTRRSITFVIWLTTPRYSQTIMSLS
jgi:TRAP-type uncharacterized transport system fused permease subunit